MPIVRVCAGDRDSGEDERCRFNPGERQAEKRRRRCDNRPDMRDGLAERTIGKAVIRGRFASARGRLDDADQGFGVDVGLGDKGLQRKGKYGDEYDEAARRGRTPHSKQIRRESSHRACNRQNPESL
jgi:hypothetical protein